MGTHRRERGGRRGGLGGMGVRGAAAMDGYEEDHAENGGGRLGARILEEDEDEATARSANSTISSRIPGKARLAPRFSALSCWLEGFRDPSDFFNIRRFTDWASVHLDIEPYALVGKPMFVVEFWMRIAEIERDARFWLRCDPVSDVELVAVLDPRFVWTERRSACGLGSRWRVLSILVNEKLTAVPVSQLCITPLRSRFSSLGDISLRKIGGDIQGTESRGEPFGDSLRMGRFFQQAGQNIRVGFQRSPYADQLLLWHAVAFPQQDHNTVVHL